MSFILLLVAMASGQDYSQLFAGFGPYLGQTVGMRDRSDVYYFLNSDSPSTESKGVPFISINILIINIKVYISFIGHRLSFHIK